MGVLRLIVYGILLYALELLVVGQLDRPFFNGLKLKGWNVNLIARLIFLSPGILRLSKFAIPRLPSPRKLNLISCAVICWAVIFLAYRKKKYYLLDRVLQVLNIQLAFSVPGVNLLAPSRYYSQWCWPDRWFPLRVALSYASSYLLTFFWVLAWNFIYKKELRWWTFGVWAFCTILSVGTIGDESTTSEYISGIMAHIILSSHVLYLCSYYFYLAACLFAYQ